MRKLVIGVCFLSLFACLFVFYDKPENTVTVKKETEKTSPSVEEVILTTSADSTPPSSYLYRGNWMTKSGNDLTRLKFQVKNNVVNGIVTVTDTQTSEFRHASFTGMIHGDTIEGVFKNQSGENGVVKIKENGTELILEVALTNKKESKKGIEAGEFKLKKESKISPE